MLIIEDDYMTQRIYKRLFKKDFEIDFAESVEKYYSSYSDKEYNIAIIDIALKGTKDGIVLIEELRLNPKHKNIPILCITAHALTRDRMLATKAGADIFLTKPIENVRLINIIHSLLKKTSAEILD